jgi:hypothetical protein
MAFCPGFGVLYRSDFASRDVAMSWICTDFDGSKRPSISLSRSGTIRMMPLRGRV